MAIEGAQAHVHEHLLDSALKRMVYQHRRTESRSPLLAYEHLSAKVNPSPEEATPPFTSLAGITK
ncbi:hypothetical protein K523DRAFT_321261 [Schizophyllum commune Tattone D]|nr:hypothetical protein K523DRAFT_321261 [Schizophyllum commune Tattone D]